jgi:hypothetical protein
MLRCLEDAFQQGTDPSAYSELNTLFLPACFINYVLSEAPSITRNISGAMFVLNRTFYAYNHIKEGGFSRFTYLVSVLVSV